MRVLFYLTDMQWTGSARAIFVAARGLAARGHQVTVACCGESRLERHARDAGLDTTLIDPLASIASNAWDLRRVLQTRFIEVALVGTARDHFIVASAMRFARRGSVLRRIAPFEPPDHQRSGKLALKLAAAGVVVTTERELKSLDTHGWPISTMVAPLGVDVNAYDGVEPASRESLEAPASGLLIACHYDPSGRNRVGALFRTVAILAPRHPTLHVALFGTGSRSDELRMHASAVGVNRIVSFLGERDDAHAIMRAADVGWSVSASDDGAFCCLDFMALRVPVIAERSPLTQHYVADGITGLLLAAAAPSYTASGVTAFLTGAEKLSAMGVAARTRVQRDFSESAMIDGYERAVNTAGDRTKWTT